MTRPDGHRPHPRWAACAAAALLAALVACSRAPQGEAMASADADAVPEIAASAAPLAPAAGAAEAKADARAPSADDANARQAPADAPRADASQLVSATGESTDARRRFVRTATARFGVDDVYRAALAIEDEAAAAGGFTTANRIATQVRATHARRQGDGTVLQLSEVATEGELVVRVPSDRAQAFLRAIAAQMAFLDARDFQANDVQFDLLRRELEARRAAQVQADVASAGQSGDAATRLDAAMARGDVLAARDEAQVARRELEDQVAFATLRLSLYQPPQVRRTTVPDIDAIVREAGPGFLAQVADALADGWRGLLQALVVGARLWPLWLLAVAAVLAVRALRRRGPRAMREVAGD